MASGPEARRAFEEFGINAAFLDGLFRYLRRTYTKASKPGGGKGTVHWDETDLGPSIAGMGCEQPSDAPATVAALYSLPLARIADGTVGGGYPPATYERGLNEASTPDVLTFGRFIENEICRVALMSKPEREAEEAENRFSAIILNSERGRAEVVFYRIASPQYYSVLFTVPAGNTLAPTLPPSRTTRLWRDRTVTLPFSIIVVAAELLADTWETTGKFLEFSGDGNANPPHDGDVPTTNENALDPARSTAPVRETRPHANAAEDNQPHAAPGPSDSLESTEIGIGFQSHSLASVRRPLLNQKDALHHAQTAPL